MTGTAMAVHMEGMLLAFEDKLWACQADGGQERRRNPNIKTRRLTRQYVIGV